MTEVSLALNSEHFLGRGATLDRASAKEVDQQARRVRHGWMMVRARSAVWFMAALWGFGPAMAEELSFEDRVKAAILDNPEIILEALEILSEREAKAALVARLSAYPELLTERTGLGIGSADAPLRVIEFFDYRCAPCKALHPGLVALTKDRADLRIEMRQLPILSPGSERAATFALASREVYGDISYGAVHAALWNVKGPLNEVAFRRIANDLNLDFSVIAPVMDSDPVKQRIAYNRDVAIALEIIGTPAFVTSESVVVGSTDIDALADLWFSR